MFNAPAVFQALITKILNKCTAFASPYMDDVIVYSETWDDHKQHIRHVLECLRRVGQTPNPDKCCWGGVTMQFLCHEVGNGNMKVWLRH